MTDDDSAALNISRRKTLAALGTIGVASAGAGLGTSAYFSDQETFENNRLVAGTLDLKIDWEEHYSDWSSDESEGLQNSILMPGDDIPTDYVGLPFCAADPSLFVHPNDLATFMDNTSIEAMPDNNNDGVQESLSQFDICSLPWDTPEILDPAGPRTANDATEDITLLEDGTPAPLIYLQDLKPGDFGEVTLSFHLCDNDGYVWLNGELTENAENGLTEPEADDPDENGGEPGELADALRACVWYDDNCDNMIVGGETECMLAIDVSESIDSNELPGTPTGVNGNAGDATRLEAVKAAIGDFDGPGFLSQLANTCPENTEIGSVSFSENLEHLDNDGDDPDSPAGNNADNEDANLDKALMPVGAANQVFPADDNGNAGTDNGGANEYEELKLLYGGGVAFDANDKFVVDDRSDNDPFAGAGAPRYDPSIDGNDDYTLINGNDTFVAERPYTGDGDSSQDDGIVKAIQALLPEGTTHPWSAGPAGQEIRGIDPSGNAAPPGGARKVIVYITDGSFSGAGEDDPDPVFEDPGDATNVSSSAENLGIDIKPILVNANPSADDVSFVDNLATSGEEPMFVNHYDNSAAVACDDDVTNAGYTCTSMVSAMQSVLAQKCAGTGGGGEEVIFNGQLVDLLDRLNQGVGIPLDGDPSTPFNELGGDPTDPNRECFVGSNTYCLGIEWWLPVDHANEIQSDSIAFDFGFYTEQCRHNSGAGMNAEEVNGNNAET